VPGTEDLVLYTAGEAGAWLLGLRKADVKIKEKMSRSGLRSSTAATPSSDQSQ